jgi:hypothetical protein
MWKHYPHSHIWIITNLLNNILNYNKLPKQWHEALLYPIPKPEWWNCDINKTRPIVLLETLRKIFTKILNNHLNTFLSTTKILQPNNQASIQGTSTMEIITKINTVIESYNQPHTK